MPAALITLLLTVISQATSPLVGSILATWVARAEAPPADFAFRFDFTPCATSTVDTFNNLYTREGTTGGPISITLALTDAEMAIVYGAVSAIDFFQYPATFQGGVLSANGTRTTVTPASSYRLQVRADGRTHMVTWTDDARPHSEAANRLLKVFDVINSIVNERPEVKRLPRARGMCL